MALPTIYAPSRQVVLTAYMADSSTVSSAWVQAPIHGYIVEGGSIAEAQVTGSANVITDGTAVSGLTWSIAASGAAGDVDSDTVPFQTATAKVKPGDSIEFISSGAGGGTVPTQFYCVIDRRGGGN
jgi:hypothetical protein